MLAINGWDREGGHTVSQDGSIAALEEDSKLSPQVSHCLVLLLPWLAGQCRPQPLHLSRPHLMPSPIRLYCQRQEGDTLPVASAVPLIFRLKACVKACPASVAAPTTVATCRGLTTVTSSAASFPPTQCGSSTSAGRLSSPGMRNLTSLAGPSPAATAVSWRWSLRWLWREMCSPPEPQHMAWFPCLSLRRWHAGQGPSMLYKGRPRRYLATITNSWGRRCSPRAVLGTTFNQSPAWHLRPSLLVSVLDMSRPPTNCQKTPTNLMVAFSGANSYSGSPNGECSRRDTQLSTEMMW